MRQQPLNAVNNPFLAGNRNKRTPAKKKVNPMGQSRVIDYLEPKALQRFINDQGKILPRRMVLDNQPSPARDIVVLNAGVALYAANVADSMPAGIALARKALESGAAKAKLADLVRVATSLAPAKA